MTSVKKSKYVTRLVVGCFMLTYDRVGTCSPLDMQRAAVKRDVGTCVQPVVEFLGTSFVSSGVVWPCGCVDGVEAVKLHLSDVRRQHYHR